MKLPIYLDHHATTPCDPRVTQVMRPYFTERFGNVSTRENAHGRAARRILDDAKAQIATLIHTTPESLHFTGGATAANHWALRGLTPTGTRDEICIGALEHDSVVEAAQASGLTVRTIPATAEGFIIVEALESVLNDRTLLVSIQMANQEIGTIQPIAELAERSHAAGALFHTDATQAAGKIPLDAAAVDLLTFSAHKFYGPQGIGALYVAPSPPLEWHPLHGGTVSLPLATGFAAACAIAMQEMGAEQRRLRQLAEIFLNGLQGYALNGASTNRLAGSLNLRFDGLNAEDILLDCAEELSFSTGSACASAKREPSPILRAIGLTDTQIASSIRLSFGRFNTEEEARFAGRTLRDKTQPARLRAIR